MGQAVAERRLALRLTQAEVADLAGVSIASVRALEAGQATLSLDLTVRIMDVLGLGLGVAETRHLIADPRVVRVTRADPAEGRG